MNSETYKDMLFGIVLIDNFVPFSVVLKYKKYLGKFHHGK